MVAVECVLAQGLCPGARIATAEERYWVLQNARGVWSRRSRSGSHPSKCCCLDKTSARSLPAPEMPSRSGNAPHLPSEVADEVVIVDKDDILVEVDDSRRQ